MKIVLFVLLVILPGKLLGQQGECLEAVYLQERFVQQVGEVPLTNDYKRIVLSQVDGALDSKKVISLPQYVLFVDRNPSIQLAVLLFVSPLDNFVAVIGADKVSTGNPNRKGYFITPLGFLKNSPENMSYRALGTKNSKGWRGLGVKGSRVWDFGWVEKWVGEW